MCGIADAACFLHLVKVHTHVHHAAGDEQADTHLDPIHVHWFHPSVLSV